MDTEYELRILEVDVLSFEEKLKDLGAFKAFDSLQKRYVYDFSPKRENEWIRLRTNGNSTTLTIKSIEELSVSGTKELEIEVSDFEKTNKILEELGYKSRSYQENRRIRYYLNNVEIDIDSWPMIPPYVEIEGKNEEEIYNVLELLGYSKEDMTTLDVTSIYEKYGINVNDIEILKF